MAGEAKSRFSLSQPLWELLNLLSLLSEMVFMISKHHSLGIEDKGNLVKGI